MGFPSLPVELDMESYTIRLPAMVIYNRVSVEGVNDSKFWEQFLFQEIG